MKQPTEDATHFQLTKWLPDADFKVVTAALVEGGIHWQPRTLDKGGKERYSIWREKRGYERRTK